MRRLERAACLGVLVSCLAGCEPPRVAPAPEASHGSVIFRYSAPGARVVQLVGSWDENSFLRGRDWTSDTTVGLMEDADRDGTWEIRVPLGPGRYEYLFRVDGRTWHLDPSNPQRVPDGAGGERSLLVVR